MEEQQRAEACMRETAWECANGVKCGIVEWVKRNTEMERSQCEDEEMKSL